MVTPAPAIASSISAQHQLLAAPEHIPSQEGVMFDTTTGYLIAAVVILAVAGYTLDKVMGVLYRNK